MAREPLLVGVHLVPGPEAGMPLRERVVGAAELDLVPERPGVEEEAPGRLRRVARPVVVVRKIRVVPDPGGVPEDLLVHPTLRIQVERNDVVGVGSRQRQIRTEDL